MKKKICLILCLCLMILGLAACGETTETDYLGLTYEEIEARMEDAVDFLVNVDPVTHAYYLENATGATLRLIETWDEAVDGLGAYQGLGDLTITKTQDTVTADQIVNFPGREVIVTYVFTYDYEMKAAVVTDASADKVYTLGEKMSKAGLNTLMGMGTVFLVLILISVLIYCFRFIPNGQNRKVPEKSQAPAPAPVSAPVSVPAQPADDLELVAAITAAIAASTGTSADSFVVRSIRRR